MTTTDRNPALRPTAARGARRLKSQVQGLSPQSPAPSPLGILPAMTTLPADHVSHGHNHAHHHEIGFIRKYVFSMDHKVIGIQFLFTSLLLMVVGGLLALAVRWQIAWPFDPANPLPGFSSRFFQPSTQTSPITGDFYNMLFTMHATFMIFFVIIPLLVGSFGNVLIPLQIGAKDMAFPLLNMLSYWVALSGGAVMIAAFYYGGAQGGWTSYPPLSLATFSGQAQTLWLIALLLVGSSSLMGSINYLTTILNLRAPGMTLFRMPLTVWSLFVTSVLILMSTPVLTAALLMLIFDRHVGTSFFTISSAVRSGEAASTLDAGQPLMWQHLFWFYSHPAVYIMILPSMGMTSDILATFARKPIFGYKPMVFAMAGIAFLGYIVWGHHMFASGMNPILGTAFMASTILIAVPSAIKTFNWLGTLWGGQIHYTPAMLFAIGFVSMFVIGGLTGIFMACTPVDIYFHDTYFIVGHIHYVLFGGSLFGIFAGIYYWFPKMFGRNMNQRLGVVHFWLTLIGFNLTFFVMHIVGIGAHPRRYATILEYPSLEHLQPLNIFMTIGALMLGMSQIPFVINFFCSLGRFGNRFIIYPLILALLELTPLDLVSWIWSFAEHGSLLTPLAGYALVVCLMALIDATVLAATRVDWSGAANRGLLVAAWVLALPLFFFPVFGKGDFWEWIGTNSTTYVISARDFISAPMQPYPMAVDPERTEASPILRVAATGEAAQTPVATAYLLNFKDFHEAAKDGNVAWTSTPLAEVVRNSPKKYNQVQVSAALIASLPEDVRTLVERHRQMVSGSIAEIARLDRLPNQKVSRTWKSARTGEFRIVAWSNVSLGWILSALTAVLGIGWFMAWGRREMEFGASVGSNPWRANSLEWYATSPPWHENFHETPVVHRGPYEFASPAAHHCGREDYLPQWDELPEGVEEPRGH